MGKHLSSLSLHTIRGKVDLAQGVEGGWGRQHTTQLVLLSFKNKRRLDAE